MAQDKDPSDLSGDSPQAANPLEGPAEETPIAAEAAHEPLPVAATVDNVPATPDHPAPIADPAPPQATWDAPTPPSSPSPLDETTTTQTFSAAPMPEPTPPAPAATGWQQSPVQPQQPVQPAPTPPSQWPQQPATGWQQPQTPAQQGWRQAPPPHQQAPAQHGAPPQQPWQQSPQPAPQWQQGAPPAPGWQQPAPPYGQPPYAQPGYPPQAGYYQHEAPYGSSGMATIAGLLLLLLGLVEVIGGALLFVNPAPLSTFVGRVQEINVGIRLTRDSLGAMPAVLVGIGIVELLAAIGVFAHRTWGRVLGILTALVGFTISVGGVALAIAVAPGASAQMIIMVVALVSYALILLGLLFGGGHFRRRYPQR